jgi:hypothetical protein
VCIPLMRDLCSAEQIPCLTELAFRAVGTVERERRRLIEFRVVAPVSTPPPPRGVTWSIALLAADEEGVLMTPAARVHSFHTEMMARLPERVAGLYARLHLAAGCASNERCATR